MKSIVKTLVVAFLVTVSVNMSALQAQSFGNVSSGMLLGIYAHACGHGLQVTSTIPGYSAEGRLFEGDVLKRATVDGQVIYDLRSLYEMENAKMAIGANREAAIEFYRPDVGLMYAWVQFTPLNGPAVAATNGVKQYKAQFKLESEKPGARRMFQRGATAPRSKTSVEEVPVRKPRPKSTTSPRDSGGAASLFGRR